MNALIATIAALAVHGSATWSEGPAWRPQRADIVMGAGRVGVSGIGFAGSVTRMGPGCASFERRVWQAGDQGVINSLKDAASGALVEMLQRVGAAAFSDRGHLPRLLERIAAGRGQGTPWHLLCFVLGRMHE